MKRGGKVSDISWTEPSGGRPVKAWTIAPLSALAAAHALFGEAMSAPVAGKATIRHAARGVVR